MMSILDRLKISSQGVSINSSCIEVTTNEGPAGFYERLRELIRGSTKQLTLASLYFGTQEKEQQLVEDIRYALDHSAELKVNLLFDYSRGQRKTSNGNSITFLKELVEEYGDRVGLYMHKMPQFKGLANRLPSPVDEVLAVFHIKAIVADSAAILTGANLSDEYFHCRQARYLVINNENFSGMMHRLIDTISSHSLRVNADGQMSEAKFNYKDLVAKLLNNFSVSEPSSDQHDTVIFPIYQHPALGLQQEKELLQDVFSWRDGELTITTPYTNFPQYYIDALEYRLKDSSKHKTLLITPSGNSHSFTTGRGLKALVPGVYLHNEIKLLKQLKSVSVNQQFQLHHYDRKGWVFHSKGLWFNAKDQLITVIGSSSFGSRSVTRDFDLSYVIATKNNSLRKAISSEVDTMLCHATEENQIERVIPWQVPIVTPLIKKFF